MIIKKKLKDIFKIYYFESYKIHLKFLDLFNINNDYDLPDTISDNDKFIVLKYGLNNLGYSFPKFYKLSKKEMLRTNLIDINKLNYSKKYLIDITNKKNNFNNLKIDLEFIKNNNEFFTKKIGVQDPKEIKDHLEVYAKFYTDLFLYDTNFVLKSFDKNNYLNIFYDYISPNTEFRKLGNIEFKGMQFNWFNTEFIKKYKKIKKELIIFDNAFFLSTFDNRLIEKKENYMKLLEIEKINPFSLMNNDTNISFYSIFEHYYNIYNLQKLSCKNHKFISFHEFYEKYFNNKKLSESEFNISIKVNDNIMTFIEYNYFNVLELSESNNLFNLIEKHVYYQIKYLNTIFEKTKEFMDYNKKLYDINYNAIYNIANNKIKSKKK